MRTIEMIELMLATLCIVSGFAMGFLLYTGTGTLDLRTTDIKFVEGSP
jgi:hypothetical protein